MDREIITTEDGSTTLYIPELNEHYHSIHGAIQESTHIFIKAGIEYYKTQGIENIYLFCEPQLEKYWSKQNFTRICGGKILKYRGLDLVPVMKKVNESTPITAAERNKIPPILLQQKGEWVLPPEEKMKLLIIKKQRKQHL